MENFLKEYKKIPRLIKLFLILILLVRIFLLTQPSFKIDMGDWQAWTARLIDVGPLQFYSSNIFADYLPFYYLFLWIIGEIFRVIFGSSAIFSTIFEIYIKAISNFFDFATAFIIFLIIKKHNKTWAVSGSLLYLINPSIIFNSSIWGQIDAIPTFLFIYSLYQLEERSNIKRWSIANALSFLIKPLNVSAFPIILIRLIKSFSAKKNASALLLTFLILFLISVPFFPMDPILGGLKHFFSAVNTYPYTSLNAYNFWSLFGWWRSDATLWFNFSYHIWGYILYASVLCIILFPYLRKKVKIGVQLDYFACALSSFGFFLFLTRIHERHLFPVFALLIISACIFKSRLLIAGYITLAIINVINLFYSYHYYNVIYNNPLASKNIFFDISSNYKLIFSAFSLIVFAIMLVVYFKSQQVFIKKS